MKEIVLIFRHEKHLMSGYTITLLVLPGFNWFSRTLPANLIKNFLWSQPHKLNISHGMPEKQVNYDTQLPAKHVVLTKGPV